MTDCTNCGAELPRDDWTLCHSCYDAKYRGPLQVEHGEYLLSVIFDAGTIFERALVRSSGSPMDLPPKFKCLLRAKAVKWADRRELLGGIVRVEFSIATDSETGTSAISIVHPLDCFKRKTGYNIALGRLHRALGLLPNRDQYGGVETTVHYGVT